MSELQPEGGDVCRPFFIVGTERSGSNLLRLVLNAHSRLCIPHPPHILHFIHPLQDSYGDLRRSSAFLDLAADVCGLIGAHAYPWDRVPTAGELVRASRGRDLFALYAAAYELQMRWAGKARWGCKSTFMIAHVDRIRAAYPHARIIYLVRDPRDVTVSAMSSIFNRFHAWQVSGRWRDEQRLGLSLLARLPPDVVTLLRYEDLLAETEAEVRRVCEFLGEAFEPGMLAFFTSREARKSASLCADWRNTGRAVMRQNAGRFSSVLSAADVAIVEGRAGAEMVALGYPPVRPVSDREAAARPSRLRRAWYGLVDAARKARMQVRSLREDRNYALRVRRDRFLLALRLKAALRRWVPWWVRSRW